MAGCPKFSGISRPMVCMRVAFHGNDGNHANDGKDEDNSYSSKQGVECSISGNNGNHENDENHGNSGCEILGFPSLETIPPMTIAAQELS